MFVQNIVHWHYHLSMKYKVSHLPFPSITSRLTRLAICKLVFDLDGWALLFKSLFRYPNPLLPCTHPRSRYALSAKNPLKKPPRSAILFLALGLCLQCAWSAPPKGKKSSEKIAESAVKEQSAEQANNSGLSAELFLEILLGELNNEGGTPATGFALLLDAAKKTQDPALYKRAVDIALHARSGPSALEAARAWKNTLPASREANRYVLDILLALNKVEQTEEPLRTDLSLTPKEDQPKAIALIPQLYASAKDKSQAAEIVERTLAPYLSREDTGSPSWVAIARLRLLASGPAAALAPLKKGLQADPQSEIGALLSMELANAHTPGADELLNNALKAQKNPGVILQWVRSLIESDRLKQAGEELTLITKRFPEFPDAWLLLGGVQLELSQDPTSEASLKQYLLLAQSHPQTINSQGLGQAYLMLAQLARKQNNDELAESWLQKIDDPQLLLRTQLQRANLLASKGKMEEAVKLIDALPENNKEDLRNKVLAKSQFFKDFRQFQQAYETLSGYLLSNPSDVDLSYELSMLAEKLKRFDEMERILRTIISTHPKYAQAYNALGFSLADRKTRLTEAKALIVKALEFSPEDPFITDSLGWAEYRLGNNIEALAILERAYSAKSDPEIAAHLGEVMWVLQKSDDALRVWREGLQTSPDNEVLKETILRLKAPL
jgi:tetratricopeptide (TPR) repeat protein